MKGLRLLLYFMLCSLISATVLPGYWPGLIGVQASETLEVVKTPLVRSETMLHTAVQIQIYHEGQEEAMDQAFDYMEEMEARLTTQLEGSDVYRINQAAGKGPVKVHVTTFEIIKKALEVSQESGGLFDITIGPVTNLWQIGSDQARVPSPEEIEAALEKVDYGKVTLNEADRTVYLEEEGMALELGGISKGFIGSGIAQIFDYYGITTAIINLGGNVVVMGTSPSNDQGWNVGVQDPNTQESRGEIVGAQRVIDGAVVTSGIYERVLRSGDQVYHHIIDPRTGYPLDNEVSSTTIFADSSFIGDAYSTAVFMMGVADGLSFVEGKEGLEVVFVDKDNQVFLSSGLEGSFQLTHEAYTLVK